MPKLCPGEKADTGNERSMNATSLELVCRSMLNGSLVLPIRIASYLNAR